ncbi:hypothetical protein FACS189467_3460 [Bacteroidia bacterium]|nr:hypothetical protein FACS189467_3460 [Bacteroidia bacterium]
MKNTLLKFALISIAAAGAVVACDSVAPEIAIIDKITPTILPRGVGDTITIEGANLDRATLFGFTLSADSGSQKMVNVEREDFLYTSATVIKIVIPEGVTFPCGIVVVEGESSTSWGRGSLITAGQAAVQDAANIDALAFLTCANAAYTDHPDETSAEYQQAVGACLQNNFYGKNLSFDSEGKPNNDYTIMLYYAITKTVSTMYTGQSQKAIAESIAGIKLMIYSFYQSLQGA